MPTDRPHPDSGLTSGSLVVVGGGGHAIVVAEAAGIAGFRVVGFLDDRADAPLARGPGALPRLGPLRALHAIGDAGWILGLGGLALRRELLAGAPGRAGVVVHPAALVSPSAVVGVGTFVGPRAVVHARAQVGAHAIVNTGAIVEHECLVGENAHIAPGAVLGGEVEVGPDALVGLGARVLPGVRIGAGAVVGGGAVVVRDVAPGATVVGVPARAR